MQFGLFGSASARRGSGEFDSTEGYHDWIEYNVEAEGLGFRSTFCVEHHFTGYGQVSATLNLLTWLGARTKSLRLGTAVMVLPWHNPVLLAEQAATLDLLSGGRLDFGIGTGYRYNEFVGFDLPIDNAREKFEESIDVILKAWTSDEPFSHKGKYWTFNNIVVEPQSFRRPHPAVWMGAGNERSIRDVARRGFNLLLGQYLIASRCWPQHRDFPRRNGGEGRAMGPDARRLDPRLLRDRRCARTRGSAATTAGQPASATEAGHDTRRSGARRAGSRGR